MVLRNLFVQEGETREIAQRREDIEAPFGRCGDQLEPDAMFGGCPVPLTNNDTFVCPDYPDCCRV